MSDNFTKEFVEREIAYFDEMSGNRDASELAERSGVPQGCLPSANRSAEAGAEAQPNSLISSVVPPKEAVRRPHCVIWRCGNAELHWINKGASIQTENGHFTSSLDHWICPRCGAGYGNTPPPALAVQRERAIRRNS